MHSFFRDAATTVLLTTLFFALSAAQARAADPERGAVSTNWTDNWENGMVSGNGRMGAIVYGKPEAPIVCVSHDRLYTSQLAPAKVGPANTAQSTLGLPAPDSPLVHPQPSPLPCPVPAPLAFLRPCPRPEVHGRVAFRRRPSGPGLPANNHLSEIRARRELGRRPLCRGLQAAEKAMEEEREDHSDIAALAVSLAALGADYSRLLAPHVRIHGAIFDRVRLDLGASPADRALTTDVLLDRAAKEHKLSASTIGNVSFRVAVPKGKSNIYATSTAQNLTALAGVASTEWKNRQL